MDFGTFGAIRFDLPFLASLASIVLIDLVLAGDNAVIIAMAVRSLPREQRQKGILFGSGVAVLLRVVLTFFVAKLLLVRYVKLAGGIVIAWIAVKLFMDSAPAKVGEPRVTTVAQAVRIIVIADITMALDNMLAVGGASHGNLVLLLFGLALSIPFVVFTSNLLSLLMDRYPWIISIGAAILGKVAAEMMLTDPVSVSLLQPTRPMIWGAEAGCAVGVVLAGRLRMRFLAAREEKREVPAVSGGRSDEKGW